MDMNKLKVIEDLIEHLSGSQGMDLKSLLDESRKPKEAELELEGEDPKGLKVESVEVMGKPKNFDDQANEAISAQSEKPGMELESGKTSAMPGEEEMTDDELQELLGKYLT